MKVDQLSEAKYETQIRKKNRTDWICHFMAEEIFLKK